jgi:sodium transport system permease protein
MMLLPIVPASYLMLHPMKATLPAMLVPVLGQTLLMSEVLRGEPLRIGFFLLAALSCAFGAAALLGWGGRLFESERIVFGRGSGS